MKFPILIIFSFLLFSLTAQVDQKYFENYSFRNIGPAGMSGRITAIDVNLRNDNIIYVGSASGGVWKSTNGGTNWDPIFDDEETLSIGSIKINQSNPDEIWVGTGEGNPRNSHNSGKGIYRSLDAGRTWKCMGLEETRIIHRIHIDPSDSDIIFAGALGSAWGPSEHRGVYKSIDGGISWKKILYKNKETGVADMIVDPENPNKIFVAMWEFGRKPWTFNSGGEGSGVFRTIDGGENWTNLSDENEGFPSGKLGRTGLAMGRNKTNVIYALVESDKLALYRSDDSGYSWKMQSDNEVGNRPFYYAEIYVDPSNENRIFNLWSYVSKSEDGGKNFKTIMDYGNNVHPDHHAFWIHPHKPDYMIDGNDGGLNISRDGGKNWRFITNLPVGQFYHVNVDNDFPFHVYGGMQDNGSWIGPGFVLKRGGIRNDSWQELYFGDGFDVAPDPRDSRYGYAMSQQGNIAYYDRETGRTRPIQPAHRDTVDLRYNWNAPLALDPYNDCGLYFGSQFVHHSTDCGVSWKTISPDLTTNDKKKQEESNTTGGLTKDVTGAENHTTLLAIAVSDKEEGVIWASSDDDRLHLTRDGGANWQSLESRLVGCPKNAWIPQIVLSSHNAAEAFIVVNNYRQNDWKPYLYHTNDYGVTFRRLVQNDDVSSFVCSVVQDSKEENLLFLGTDVGLYTSFDKGVNWTKWENFPSVQIRDMVIQEEMSSLVLGTFGRAFWVLDDLGPLREMCSEKADLLKDSLHVFSSPDAYQTASRSYQGIRFVAQGEFAGENKRRGAQVYVWKLPDEDKKEGVKEVNKKAESKAQVHILNVDQDTIRSFEKKLTNGMNIVSWRMDAKGYRSPSWADRSKQKNEPGGWPVEPGTYKMIVELGNQVDSTTIELKADPRIEFDGRDFRSKTEMLTRHKETVMMADSLFEKLKTSKKKIKFINQYSVTAVDSVKEKITERGTDLSKQIDSLTQLFLTPQDVKGYVSQKDKLNPLIWGARGYINGSWEAPGDNALIRLENLEKRVGELEVLISDFYDGDWTDYQTLVKSSDISLFDSE